MLTSTTLRIAHRGASGYAPENTLSAFSKALELGVDMIECDVRTTRDSELVVFHDARINRLTGGQGYLAQYTYDELRRFDVGGEPIPRLIEALELVGDRCALDIEIKERGLARTLVERVHALGLQRTVLFTSFLHAELLEIKALDPHLRVGVLLTTRPTLALTAVSVARAVGAEGLVIPRAIFHHRYVRAAHRNGLAVYVWTVDDPEDIDRAKRLGVDGIISNYPDRI